MLINKQNAVLLVYTEETKNATISYFNFRNSNFKIEQNDVKHILIHTNMKMDEEVEITRI